MSVLFVCDHIFKINNGNVYSNGFPYTFFQEYLDVFSGITVICRYEENENVSGMALASGDGIEFIFLENISTLASFFGLRQKYRNYLNTLMDHHEGVIARLPTELGLLAAQVAHKRGKKCLLEVVGCAWDALWNYGGLKAKLYAPVLYKRMKNTVKTSSFVVYDTEKFLQARYPCSKSANSFSIADVRLGMTDDMVLAKRNKKIISQDGKIILGTIGSLHTQYKGIDTAIKAFGKLAKRCNTEFEYRVLGEGNLETYKKLAKVYDLEGKVFFDGRVPNGDAVWEWIDQLDIYVQPSLAEALSRSLIEAMSRGCPSIGSNAGGIPELLEQEVVFPVKNEDLLADIILKLLSSKTLMKYHSERNFYRVVEYSSVQLQQKRQALWQMFKDH